MTNSLSSRPIPLKPDLDGGALNWFDHLDEQHRACLRFLGPTYPASGTAGQRERWLIDRLRETHEQQFFFLNLAHKGMALDFQEVETHPFGWSDLSYTQGKVSLAQLFLLPNENPAEELAQLHSFLSWLDVRLDNQGQKGRDGTVQWGRQGYSDTGLKANGFADPAAGQALTQEIQQWRSQPWFEAWYRANLAGFGKVRLGPYCWSTLTSLVPNRVRERLRALPALSDEELGLA